MSTRGMRYVAIYRCSSDVQTEKSIPDQQMVVQEYARSRGLIHAGGDIIQAGVSASTGRQRHDVAQLIERRKTLRDFDVVVVHDFSRFTRRGGKDGARLEALLEDEGVQVLSATEHVPEGAMGDVVRSIYYGQANEYVRGNAQRTARGQMSTILNGESVGPRPPTYGIDRLYVSKSGQARHRIRGLLDGSQAKLHPTTLEVLTVYEKQPSGRGLFYRKQDDENVHLVPGDPKELDVVRRIFHMAVIEGLGYYAIAKILDGEGIPAARGGRWHKACVQRILKNPVYTGRLIVNRMSSALYWRRSVEGPVAVTPNEAKANRNRSKDASKTMFYRPSSEWVRIDVPETRDILDSKLRELALPYQDRLLEYDAQVRGKTGIGKDKYPKSSFFLKDVLTLKEDGSPMCGQVANKKKRGGGMYRYYRARGYGELKNVGTQRMCRIPADPVEAMVKDVLCRLFTAFPNSRELVKQAVLREQALRHEAKTQINELKQRRERLKKKIGAFADFSGDIDDEWLAKVESMKATLRDLDVKLKSAEGETVDGDPDEIADSVVREMGAIGEAMPEMTLMTLRRLLTVLVERMEVDLFTREVWLTLRLPSWALLSKDAFTMDKVCLGTCSWPTPLPEANYHPSQSSLPKPDKLPESPDSVADALPGLPDQPARDGLLLADVKFWCTRASKHAKGVRNFDAWRLEVLGGILPPKGPEAVSPPPLPVMDAENFVEPNIVRKKKPFEYEWFKDLPPLPPLMTSPIDAYAA